MGCSNPHPHGQVWSLSAIPSLPATELTNLRKYSLSTPSSNAPKGPLGRPCLLCDYVTYEVSVAQEQGRVVLKNEHWVALVPWWAIWPFEVMRKIHVTSHSMLVVSLMHLFSLAIQAAHTFYRSPHCGRDDGICADPIPDHRSLRQPLLVLLRLLDGYSSASYSARVRRRFRRPGRRERRSPSLALCTAVTSQCLCSQIPCRVRRPNLS